MSYSKGSLPVPPDNDRTPPPSYNTSKRKLDMAPAFVHGQGQGEGHGSGFDNPNKFKKVQNPRNLKRTFSTYGVKDWIEETVIKRSMYKQLIKLAKKTLKIRE